MKRIPSYDRTGRLRYSFIAAFAINACIAFADPEYDPFPGPPAKGNAEAIVTPRDEVTPENTRSYPTPKEARVPAWPAQKQPSGALSGRIIYTSGGHGFHAVTGGWDSDRPTYQQISEDLGNQDQMTQFVYQAFNAGATVVPYRPVGNQVNEVVIDNDDPQVTFTGSWTNSSSTPFYGTSSDPVHYAFSAAEATETATARYTPNIPQRGYYPVYGWALDGTNRCVDQLYRIVHAGGISEIRINHRMVGKGWVYLGTYYFEQGTGGYCEISNQSSSPVGSNAIADAIRFGNGMGDINRGSGVSGLPREEESSRYWIQSMMGWGTGRDTTVYDRSGDDGSDNVGAPPRMAAYMNRETVGTMTDRVFLSFHSNGGGGSARGALGLWNNEADPDVAAGTATPNQYELAVMQGREVNLDMRAVGSPPLEYAWSTRTTHDYWGRDYAYGEMRWDTINHEMDATINEVGFHDNLEDARLLGESNARIWIARAAVQGLVRYFNQYGGAPLAFSPEPPVGVKAVGNANGSVTVTWNQPATAPWGSQPPTGYVVYTSSNGYGFGNPIIISGAATTQAVIPNVATNQPVYFRVASTNAGGESLPSEVVAVRLAPGTVNSTLVVNGFDRMDRALSPTETNIGLTAFKRVKPWKANNYDHIVQHAKALHQAGFAFDSSANEVLSEALLGNYQNLIWILGEESTADSTFSASEQLLVTNFLSNGKNLFFSGTEVGWDLDQANNGRSFYENVLGNNYVSDDAGTYAISGGSGIFGSIGSFNFGPAAPKNNTSFPPAGYPVYDADFPDVLAPANATGSAVLHYSNGQTAGLRVVKNDSKIISLGFPFECITSEAVSGNIMDAVMNDFQPPLTGIDNWSVY